MKCFLCGVPKEARERGRYVCPSCRRETVLWDAGDPPTGDVPLLACVRDAAPEPLAPRHGP